MQDEKLSARIIISANCTDDLTWLKAAIVSRVPIKSSFYFAIIAATFQSCHTITIRVTITFINVALIARLAARISSKTSYNYKNEETEFQVQRCEEIIISYKLVTNTGNLTWHWLVATVVS